MHVEDLLARRTRLCYEHRNRGLAAIDEVAKIAADILGWDEAAKAHEIENYKARCDAEEKAEGIVSEDEAQKVREQAVPITEFIDVSPQIDG